MVDEARCFPIRDVTEGLVDGGHETLGTKTKVWLREPSRRRVLFKEARPNTGEDWSERLAAELAGLLGLPHAEVDLAVRGGTRGVIVVDFIPVDHDLVHGNELMSGCLLQYPKEDRLGGRQHTPAHVAKALAHAAVGLPAGFQESNLRDGFDLFVGYLLLDALIGNTDRHHENWGAIAGPAGSSLAPTYDHASSLGRELTDQWFQRRRGGRNADRLWASYADRTRSALYGDAGDRPLHPVAAFQSAQTIRPAAAAFWLERLSAITAVKAAELVAMVPRNLLKPQIGAFVADLLEYNRARLIALS